MLIQEGLSKLKTIRKRMQDIRGDVREFSVWNSKIKHPWGIKGGNQDYNIKEAEQVARSKIQSYHDLKNEFLRIKTAIDRTNIQTKITVAGKEFTLHEAILYKREVAEMLQELVGNYEHCALKVKRDVDRENEKDNVSVKSDVIYLFPSDEVEKTRKFINEFLEEVDGKMQIANATVNLIFDE